MNDADKKKLRESVDRLIWLIGLVCEAEGMRRKAEWDHDHETYGANFPHEGVNFCSTCGQKSNWMEQHFWKDAEWIEETRKELLG